MQFDRVNAFRGETFRVGRLSKAVARPFALGEEFPAVSLRIDRPQPAFSKV
jgi:hypothetical protein